MSNLGTRSWLAVVAVALAALAGAAEPVLAATFLWTGGDLLNDNWNDQDNWGVENPPGSGTYVTSLSIGAGFPGQSATTDVAIIDGLSADFSDTGLLVVATRGSQAVALNVSVTLTSLAIGGAVPVGSDAATTNNTLTFGSGVTLTAGTVALQTKAGASRFNKATLNMSGSDMTVTGTCTVVGADGSSSGSAILENSSTTSGILTIGGTGTFAGPFSDIRLNDLVVGIGASSAISVTTGAATQIQVLGDLTVNGGATLDLNQSDLSIGATFTDTSNQGTSATIDGTVIDARDVLVGRTVSTVGGAGSLSCVQLIAAEKSTGSSQQTTTINITVVVSTNVNVRSNRDLVIGGTARFTSTTTTADWLTTSGDGRLGMTSSGLLVFEFTGAGPHLIDADGMTGTLGSFRIEGGASATYEYPNSGSSPVRSLAGNLEVVQGHLTLDEDDDYTIGGSVSVGTRLDGSVTGSATLDASTVNNASSVITVGGGSLLFGTTSPLPVFSAPSNFVLNGSGSIALPTGFTATFDDLNVGATGSTTTILGLGTLRTTGVLTVGAGELQGGAGAANAAVIEINGSGTGFSVAAADFAAGNMRVRYTNTGANSDVANVTYRHLDIATTGRFSSTTAPLAVTGDLAVQSGTLRFNAGTTTVSVGGTTSVAGSVQGNTTTVAGTFTGGLSTTGSGQVSANTGSLSLTVGGTGLSNDGTGGITTGGGFITVSAGDLSTSRAITTGGGVITVTTGNLTATSVNGVVTTGAGAVQVSAGNVTVTSSGQITSSGPLTAGGSLVTSGAGAVSVQRITVASGVDNGGSLTVSSGSSVGGSVSTSGTLTFSSPLTMTVGASWTSSGTFTTGGAASVLDFTGNGTITTSLGLPSVRKSGAGTTSFASATTSLSGSIQVTGGTLELNGTTVSAQAGALVSSGATLSDTSGTTGTLRLSSSGNLGGAGTTLLRHLDVQGATTLQGAVTVQGDLSVSNVAGNLSSGANALTVGGALTVQPGRTFNAAAASALSAGSISTSGSFTAPTGLMSVAGAFTIGGGTFTTSSGTVAFTGGSAQAFARGAASLASFTISGAGGVDATQGLVYTGSGNVASGRLHVTGGNLDVGTQLICAQPVTLTGNTLVLAAGTISGASTLTLDGVSYSGTTGVISVAETIYDSTAGAATLTAAARVYGGALRFQGPGATFRLMGAPTLSVAGTVRVETGVEVKAAPSSAPTLLDIGDDLAFGGTGKLTAGGFPRVQVAGDVTGGGYVVAPTPTANTLELDGLAAQSISMAQLGHLKLVATKAGAATFTTTGTFQVEGSLDVLGGTLAPTAATELRVKGAMTIGAGASYAAGATALRFNGTTTFTDATDAQVMGDVAVSTGSSLTLASSIRTDDLGVEGSGTLSTAGFPVEVRGSWSVSTTGAFTPGTSTVTLAGAESPVTVDSGGDAFRALVVAKVSPAALVTVTGDILQTALGLDIQSGSVRLANVDLDVGGSTLVEAGSKLTLSDVTARNHSFGGALTLAPGTAGAGNGGSFALSNGALASVVTFATGFVVSKDASFVATQGAGALTFRIGANTFSRVGGAIADPADVTTKFELLGSVPAPNPTFSLVMLGGAPGSQWFLAYNRQTESQDPVIARMKNLAVSDSDANAGHLVRAPQSRNNGGNENWSFGGDDKIRGTLLNAGGAAVTGVSRRLKIFQRTGIETNISTADTSSSTGAFEFELTLNADDRVVIFVDGEPTIGAAAALMSDPGANELITGFDVREGRLVLTRITSTAVIDTTVLDSMDSSAVGDSDVPFTVDGATGTLTIAGTNALELRSAAAVTLSGNLIVGGDALIDGSLALGAGTTNSFGAGLLVNGAGAVTGGKDTTVNGDLTLSGAGRFTGTTGSLTVAGVNGALLGGSGDLSGATLSLTTGGLNLASTGSVSMTAAINAASASGKLTRGGAGSVRAGPLTIGGLGIVSTSGGTGIVAAGVSVNGPVTFSGGGTFAADGVVDVAGDMSFTGGFFRNTGVSTRLRSNLTLSGADFLSASTTIEGASGLAAGASSVTVTSLTLTNATADVVFTGGTGRLTAAGIVDVARDLTLSQTGTGDAFTNTGAVIVRRHLTVGPRRFQGGTDTTVMGTVTTGGGDLVAGAGTFSIQGAGVALTLNGAGNVTGAVLSLPNATGIQLQSSGRVDFTGAASAPSPTASISLNGSGDFRSGGATLGGGVSSSGAGSLVSTAGLTLGGGISFTGSGNVIAAGAVDVSGAVVMSTGRIANTGPTSRFRLGVILSGGDMSTNATTIEGSGGLAASGATSITVTTLAVTAGSLDMGASSGTLRAAGAVSVNQNLVIATSGSGAAYVNTGATSVGGSLTVGPRSFVGGTDLTVGGNATLQDAGTLSAGTGLFSVSGATGLTLQGAGGVSCAALSVTPGRIVVNGAGGVVASGAVSAADGAAFSAASTGSLEGASLLTTTNGVVASGTGDVVLAGGASVVGGLAFTGPGDFTASGAVVVSTGNVVIGPGDFVNTGASTSILTGSLTLKGGDFTGGATSVFTGITAGPGLSDVSVTSLTVTSGGVTYPGTSSGRLTASGSVAIGGNLLLQQTGGAGFIAFSNTGATAVSGNLTLAGGGFVGGTTTSVTGAITLGGAGAFDGGSGGTTAASVSALGVGGLSAGSFDVSGNVTLSDDGGLTVVSGALAVGGALTIGDGSGDTAFVRSTGTTVSVTGAVSIQSAGGGTPATLGLVLGSGAASFGTSLTVAGGADVAAGAPVTIGGSLTIADVGARSDAIFGVLNVGSLTLGVNSTGGVTASALAVTGNVTVGGAGDVDAGAQPTTVGGTVALDGGGGFRKTGGAGTSLTIGALTFGNASSGSFAAVGVNTIGSVTQPLGAGAAGALRLPSASATTVPGSFEPPALFIGDTSTLTLSGDTTTVALPDPLSPAPSSWTLILAAGASPSVQTVSLTAGAATAANVVVRRNAGATTTFGSASAALRSLVLETGALNVNGLTTSQGVTLSAGAGTFTVAAAAATVAVGGALDVRGGALVAGDDAITVAGRLDISGGSMTGGTVAVAGPLGQTGGAYAATGTTAGQTLTVGAGSFTSAATTITANLLVTGGTFASGRTDALGDATLSGGAMNLSAAPGRATVTGAFVQSAGTFTGGTALTIRGTTMLSGGTHNAALATLLGDALAEATQLTGASVVFTAGSAVTVSGDMIQTAGTYNATGVNATTTVRGSLSFSGGASPSTFNSGLRTQVDQNLVLAGLASSTFRGDAIAGTAIEVGRSVLIDGATLKAPATLDLGVLGSGDWSLKAGAVFDSLTGTVRFRSSGNVVGTTSSTFFNLVVDPARSVAILFDTDIDTAATVGAGGSLAFSSSRITLSGANPLQGAGDFLAQGSTVIYDSTTGATIRSLDYNNLEISGNDAADLFQLQPLGDLLFAGNLTVRTGVLGLSEPGADRTISIFGSVRVLQPASILDDGVDLDVQGDWTVFDADSTLYSANPVVRFSGFLPRSITATTTVTAPLARFPNLHVDKSTSSGVLTLSPATDIVADGDVEVIFGRFGLSNRSLTVGGGDLRVRINGALNQGVGVVTPTAGAVTLLATGRVAGAGPLDVFTLAIGDGGTPVVTTVSGTATVWDRVLLPTPTAGSDRLLLDGALILRRDSAGPYFENFTAAADFTATLSSLVAYRGATGVRDVDGTPIIYHALELTAAAGGTYRLVEDLSLTGGFTASGGFSGNGFDLSFVDAVGVSQATAATLALNGNSISRVTVDKTLGGTVALVGPVATGRLDVKAGTLVTAGHDVTVAGDATVLAAGRILSAGGTFLMATPAVPAATTLGVGGTVGSTLGALRLQNTGGAVSVTGGKLTVASLTAITPLSLDLATAVLGPVDVSTTAGPSTIAGTGLAASAVVLRAPTTISTGDLAIAGSLDVRAAVTLAPGASVTIAGAPNPLTFAGGSLATGAGSMLEFAGAGAVNIPGDGAGALTSGYRRVRFTGGGAYTLLADASAEQVLVASGALSVNDLSLTVPGGSVTVSAAGELAVRTTAGSTAPGRLAFTGPAAVSVSGTLRLLGSVSALPNPPAKPAIVTGSASYTIAIRNGGRIEASRYAITAPGDAAGVLQIDSGAAVLGGNDGLREGTFTLTSGAGLALNVAISNQDLLLQEVRFEGAGGVRSVRHATTLGGTTAPSTRLRVRTTTTGDPTNASLPGFPGTLWGDRFDVDFGAGDSGAAADASPVSRGTILWDDSRAPAIVRITTLDLFDAAGVLVPNGAIDRIVVDFDEAVSVASASPGGFSIDGKVGARLVTTGITSTSLTIDFVASGIDRSIVGTAAKSVSYSAAAGGVLDSNGQALAGAAVTSVDAAGPTILEAIYDNKASVAVAGDTLTLRFSESVVAPPAASALATTGFALLGSESVSALGLDRAVVTLAAGSNGGVIPFPTARVALAAGALTDLAAAPNATPAVNRERPLVSATDANGAQAYELVVSASAASVPAGVSVEYTVRALDREGRAIPGFQPRGGLRFEVVGTDGVSTGGLETRPGDVSNFQPFSTQGLPVAFDASAEPPVFTMGTTGQLTFDASGDFRVNLSNTKATANLAGATSSTKVRATEIATPATGLLGSTVTWEHGVPASVLTLFGDGDPLSSEQGEERLVQGVRDRSIAVAVSQTAARIERTAGTTFTARVALVDEYFNVATRSTGDQVSVRPFPRVIDPRRAANLEQQDGEPLDSPQDATLTAGISTVQVKSFLAALGHRYLAATVAAGPAGTPSTFADVIPGDASGIAVVLPGQSLLQGVPSSVNPVAGTPFGAGLVAQGSNFEVQLFAIDAHGNWDFRFGGATTTNALVVKVNDTKTSAAAPGDFESDTVAQRFGTSISAIGAASAIPPSSDDLSLAFNGGSPISINLDGRQSGTEIRDLLQASLSAQTPLAARGAKALLFPAFSRYVVRSGDATTPALRSEVDAASAPSATAEVNLLRLGADWVTGGIRADGTFPSSEPGRAANEFSALFYDAGAGAGADSDLLSAVPPSPDFERLGFVHGVAFASAHSDVDTGGLAFRRVVARFRTPIGGTREYSSDAFQVSQGALLVNKSEAFDDSPRDGAIDRIVITFEPSDTIDSVAAALLTASDFRLTYTSGASSIVRSGVAVRADEVGNTLEIAFTPGLPTTTTDGVTLTGPTLVRGKLTQLDLSGGIASITDAAPPAVLSSRATADTLEVTFSEPIQVRAGRGASVSGVHDDPAGVVVPAGASLVFTDGAGAPITVTFAGGASGAPAVVTVLGGFGIDAAFENGRFILRAAAAATASTPSTANVTAGAGLDAAAILKLGAAESADGAREVVGIFNPGEVESGDLIVTSRDGRDLRAGPAFIVGNTVVVPLSRLPGDTSTPFFALVDDFNQSFVSDVSAAENAASFIQSNLPGLDTQNTADASGLIQVRERDIVPGDGIIEGVAPGVLETDIAASPLPAALVSRIDLVSIAPLGTGQIAPRLLRPVTTSAAPLTLGTRLEDTQVAIALLSPGAYALTYRVRLTGAVPLGIAISSLGEISRTFTIRVDDLPAVPAAPQGPIVVVPGASFTLDASASVDPNDAGVFFQWRHLSGPAVATFGSPGSEATTVDIPSVAGIYTVELAVDDGAPARAVRKTFSIVAQGGAANRVPTADAGLDKVVALNSPSVELDGSGSFDPDGAGGLQFAWTQVEGPVVTLRTDSAEPALAKFRAPAEPALLTFRLTIFDGVHSSLGDTVAVAVVDPTTGDGPPFLAATVSGGVEEAVGVPYRFGRVDRPVTLDGSSSIGLPRVTTYRWTQTGGPTVDLLASGDGATFWPVLPGTYRFSLAGDTAGVAAVPAEVSVRVVGAAGSPPVVAIDSPDDGATVQAGAALSVVALSGTPGALFSWRQLEGPLAPLSAPSSATTQVTPPEPGVYVLEVVVTDPATGASDAARVRFGADEAGDRLPIADFTEVEDSEVGLVVSLDGGRTTPEENTTEPLRFDFVQTGGLPALLSGAEGRAPLQTFTPKVTGAYAFELVVSQGNRRSVPVRRAFQVAESSTGGGASTQAPRGGGGGGGGCAAAPARGTAEAAGALLPLAALALLLAAARRRAALLRPARVVALLSLLALPLVEGCAAGLIGGAAVALSGGGGGEPPDTTKPDLVVSSVGAPASALVVEGTDPDTLKVTQRVVFMGDEGRLRANVVNQGDDLAPAAVTVDWYLSRTKTIDGSAFRVREHEAPAVEIAQGGALRVVSEASAEDLVTPETADATLEPGRYALLARVNRDGRIAEHDATNNDVLSEVEVEVYRATGALPATGNADIVITALEAPIAALANTPVFALVRFTNVGAPLAAPLPVTFTVILTSSDTLAGGTIVASGAFTITPTAEETPLTRTLVFQSPVSGRFRMAVRFITPDATADDNTRFATNGTTFYATNVLAENGASLPRTSSGDPTTLDITSQRPALQTSLPLGGQRTLAFRLPNTGVDPVRVQALITVSSFDFDPIMELLSPAGAPIRVADDFRGGTQSVIYDTLTAQGGTPLFFLIIGSDDATASGSFSVNVNINGFGPGDDEPVQAIETGDIVSTAPEEVSLDEDTRYTVPFELRSIETEVYFEIPAPGRFPISVRPTGVTRPAEPLFLDDQETTLVLISKDGAATEVPFVIERGLDGELLLLSHEDDGLFGLTAGGYVLVLHAQALPFRLDQTFEVAFGRGVRFDRTVKQE